ncbi:MAG: ferredoxin [Acidobacteria bacterium]|nr:ferredoxin [Acidobacteriota bacterium]
MGNNEKPHKDNAPGPFYVCDGCCTACELPFTEAPELFEYDSDNHCFVKRQPETKDELNKMLRALYGAELECIRYGGSDPEVLRRLAESGQAHLSDITVSGIKQVLRNHVTFDAVDPIDKLLLDKDLAIDFQNYLRSRTNEYLTYKFTKTVTDGEKTSFSYSWYEDNFHKIEFHFLGLPECRWLIVSDTFFTVYDWLVDDGRFCNQRWYTKEQWNTSKEWQDIPW